MAAVTGLILFKKYYSTAAKFFILFLVYIAICDLISAYTYLVRDNGVLGFLNTTYFQSNHWWSTLYWEVGAVVFYSFYFYKLIKTKLYCTVIKYSGLGFLSFSILYIIVNFEDYFNSFFPEIAVFGAIIILLCVTLYFIEILKSEDILTFYKSLNFYISTAILLWWLIATPLVFYNIYFSSADWDFVVLQDTIYILSNIFMYSIFTFGLIYSKPEYV